jgi:hypothetical protein
MLNVIVITDKCRYAERQHAECRGALNPTYSHQNVLLYRAQVHQGPAL